MEPTIRKFESLKEVKAAEYRYWQSRSAHERMSAVTELTLAAYGMKEPAADIRELLKNVVCSQRIPRK